jgi:hypothetical protein
VTDFFKEKNIPGELHHDEWVGFDVNKTKLFDYCYKKTDYIIHLDADDLIEGDFQFTREDAGKTMYKCYAVRGTNYKMKYMVTFMMSNQHRWKFCGVAHTIIKCLDCPNVTTGELAVNNNFLYISRDTGNRKNDDDKYLKDAERLKEQFFQTVIDDPDGLNSRSAFYCAQSYRDSGKQKEALEWYSLYTKLKNTWVEEVYLSYCYMGPLMESLKYPFTKIEAVYLKAIETIPDRGEAMLSLGRLYNHNKRFDDAYQILLKAKQNDYSEVLKKYLLFNNENCYGKYIHDELSVACYWLGRFVEGTRYLDEIIDDKDFEKHRARLQDNNLHFLNNLNNANNNKS